MSDIKDLSVVHARKTIDADLSFLVNIANNQNVWTGVTLFSKGFIITGIVISGKEYYNTVADSFAKNEIGNLYGDYFRKVAVEAYSNDENNKLIPANFIHLKDVKISAGNGGLQPIKNGYLRLKLEEIDGHMIGSASI